MDFDMIWTAIIKKDNVTRATTFMEANSPAEAYRSIWTVLQSDGYEVLGIMKGNQVECFYGVDMETLTVNHPDPLRDVKGVISGK